MGSYRIGNGAFIYKNIGADGFYSNTLFKYKKEMFPYLEDSIELGRSFVQPKYWGTRALDYIWYGIGSYLHANPQIKYMYGPVSISNSYPGIAKDMIVFYYSHYFKAKEELVESKLSYQYGNDISYFKDLFVLNDRKADFKILKSSLSTIGVSIPTLYKQYGDLCIEEGVSFHGFNIDENFSDCIDGFILVEIDKIKESQRKRYIK